MGLGVEREAVGDIIPRDESCDIVVTKDILAYVMANLEQAGRTRLKLEVISEAEAGVQEFRLIQDTVASLRLDAVTAAGFSLSREKTLLAVNSGKVSVNSLECKKPDRTVCEGDKITLRGYGRIEITSVKGRSRKGRTIIKIKRYI
jgi:RNA-binding protein YlmH